MPSRLAGLEDHVARLLDFLGQDAPLPAYRDILVLEASDRRITYLPGPEPSWQVPAEALHTLPEFAPRFATLLEAGYSWINLSAYGIFGGNLILAVEVPRHPANVPPGLTSVNYSGPPLDPSGARQWMLRLIVES